MIQPDKQQQFGLELTALLNRYSYENESGTPDFILTAYLITCLNAFNDSVRSRRIWFSGKENDDTVVTENYDWTIADRHVAHCPSCNKRVFTYGYRNNGVVQTTCCKCQRIIEEKPAT